MGPYLHPSQETIQDDLIHFISVDSDDRDDSWIVGLYLRPWRWSDQYRGVVPTVSHELEEGHPEFHLNHLFFTNNKHRAYYCPAGNPILQCELSAISLEPGDALILYTGRADQFLSDSSTYYQEYSTLGYDACEWLVLKKVRLVGLDAPDLDLPSEYIKVPFAPKNHRLLLSQGIYIIENVGGQIVEVLNRRVELIPAPLKIQGEYASGAPVRLLARV